MQILMAASEMTPYAKTGGLADVISSLSRELAARGHNVSVVIPFYRCVREFAKQAELIHSRITVTVSSKQVSAEIWRLPVAPRLSLLMVRRDEYFDRSEIYRLPERDYEDNAKRFIFFSKVVVALSNTLQIQPDILHCHDWQTALVPLFASLAERNNGAAPVRSIFTIHNLAYQGRFWSPDFSLLNLPPNFFSTEALEFYGEINLMKAGIIFSNEITTVSRKYAAEIQTHEQGCGLDGVLRSRAAHLRGILNGADYDEWNPETDPFLAGHFNTKKMQGKQKCKSDLLRLCKFNGEDLPLIGVVSRLTGQKGLDLLATGTDPWLALKARWVFLGTGEKHYEDFLLNLAKKYPKQVSVRIAFDNAMAHKIVAGSDFFLMPSHYEPCGLGQMYSLRYGTIPIVRATGGLEDTITHYNPTTREGNGFKFYDYSSEALFSKVRDALSLYPSKTDWPQIRRNAMSCDFSWARATGDYEKLYIGS